ncbi:MAG: GntR family transcriptional regulator [Tannerella sp.]|jgi:DNA-binding GntR family transcriptional regulator|nr:GntR family transcriptional regulator [Tannerella sp.]
MSELPQYRQIYEKLRAQIAAGEYVPGDLLPSEHELCMEYSVARLTVRKALEQLVADDFIIRHQGKGSIVKGTPKGIGILSLMSTTSALDSTNLTTHITLKPELREWQEAFTFPIELQEEAAGCIYFERLRLLDGEPVFYDITMLPNMNLPRFLNYDMENKSLFDTLRTRYQIVVTGGVQQLFAIRADKRLQKSFHLPSGYPVLQLNRKIDTNRPGFHIYSQVFCVTQRYGLIGSF